MKTLLHAGALALVLLSCAPVAAQSYDPTRDPWASNFDAVSGQCSHWTAITPSDTTDLPSYPKALYVGTGGDIAMIGIHGPVGAAGVVWKGSPAGSILPVRPRRVLATGTTASSLLACF